MRVAFVGHLCIDRNVIRGETETFYGGGVVHGAVTTVRLGGRALVLTRCAEAELAKWESLADTEVEVRCRPSRESTSIRNVYPSDNPDDRQSYLVSRAEPFTAGDLEGLSSEIVHVNPLWYGEFPPDLLLWLRPRVAFLAGDAQGFLRRAGEDGRMEFRDLEHKDTLLPLFDLFKADSKEARILTGHEDIRQAAGALRAMGPRTVLLTHAGGVCVFDGSEICESPFTGFTLEGRTGRGDTCTAAFLFAMRHGGLRDATAFAAEITSRKMQYRGPYRG